MGMKLMKKLGMGTAYAVAAWLLAMVLGGMAWAQGVTTTTVAGTVYLANGQPGSGTLAISWPSFTTASGQAVTADTMTVTIAPDGFVSVNLAPNAGATPSGEYYTAVYYLSDGTVTTQYWVVPSAASATLAQVQAQVMPATQAVQTVSKAYVDEAITELTESLLTASGGTLSGPLYLNADPTQPMQAATKHYVDTQVATALPLTGGTVTGTFTALEIGGAYQADQYAGGDFGAKLQACLNALSASYGGTCDARNFTGSLSMASNLTIATSNAVVWLPCATVTTAKQIVVTAGTRNVSLRGCALRGGSAASGSRGGTVFAYSGAGAMVQVGDPTYAVDTPGFHMDNVAINITASSSATAEGLVAYRAQELDLESLYFLGNSNQTGMTLDGTGNYTGGTIEDNQFTGFGTAVNGIGHQVASSVVGDWANASAFVRLHIDCPTSSGSPIGGTYGINLLQGDGNTFTGGDVEGCATALHLGANAVNNTIVGLRNENSTNQIVADTGSSYNSWITGGAMYTGKLTDNGTRNSFLDTFHRSFNGLNGDWYGSQEDATLTNHVRLGIGLGNERGLLDEIQTDYGYRWTSGFTDGTSGLQAYQIQDLVNNVARISVAQYLSATANVVTNVAINNGGCYTSSTAPAVSFAGGGGTGAAGTASMTTTSSTSCAGGYTVYSVTMTAGGSGYTSQPTVSFAGSNQTTAPSAVAEIATAGSTNNPTAINSAGTGAVVLNGSSGAGTGGVIIGSGGTTETTVATVDKSGDATFTGNLLVGGTTQSTGTLTVRNNADAEVDYYLWPGLTASQKGSFTYKDWNGNSQWYMVKNATNDWALNSAVGGLDSFKAYQSSNSGDTYIDASNTTGHIRLNYESGSGAETDIYSGSSSSLVAAFQGTTSIKFPGLAASSGHYCLQVDTSGYVTNTGSACGTGSGGSTGTINSGTAGQIAYYTASGTTLGGESLGTANLSDWTDSGIASGDCPVWNATTSKWTPGSCGASSGTSYSSPTANYIPKVLSATSPGTLENSSLLDNGTTVSTTEAVESSSALISGSSPVCDIRAFGATLGSQDIGPYVQDCINSIYPWTSGNTQTILLPCGNHNPGCYWDNPSTLTYPYGGPFKIKLQGYLTLGSPLVFNGYQDWYGDGPPGANLQFQTGTPALITAPAIYGTLGTAITTADTATTITPAFTAGNIAHMPAGAAITIAETTTVSGATATAVSEGSYRQVTLVLPSETRYLPMETLTVSGCSDATLDIANGVIAKVDYSASGGEQVVYAQSTTTTATSATGCTVKSFDEDKYESVRLFCSNGTNMSGYSYTCTTGQWTIIPQHTHSASAVWGAVAVSPGFSDQGGHSFRDINITQSYGMSYWGEQESNLDLYNVGMSPVGYLAAGGMEETASWVGTVGQLNYAPSSVNPGSCEAGGCSQPSYPFGLRCDSESSGIVTGGGSSTNTGCASFMISGGSMIGGGIKIDGNGRRAITTLPYKIENMLFEQAPNAALTVDNRFAIDPTACLNFSDNSIQDNITEATTYILAYTDNAPPSLGCYRLSDLGTALTPYYINPYFNDAVSIDRTPYGTSLPDAVQAKVTAASPEVDDGRELQAAVRGSGAGLGPQVLPFGSLAIDNSPSDWATDCATAGCTAVTANITCPDGPQATSKMQCAELDGPGAAFTIGSWTGATYAGDQFIYGCYIRPGANFSFPVGLQNQDAFMLYTTGSDAFMTNAYGGTLYTTPSYGFGTRLAHNTWYPLIAVATIATGETTSHTINFMIGSGNGNAGTYAAGYGNQFSNCRWAFVPGPNNPGYTGVTQDEVAFARDNQYRGAAPSSVSAGTAATEQTIATTGGFQANGVALNAPSESYNASASGAITLPSSDRAEATYVLSGNVTASIGSGSGGSKVTVFVCQPASGGPYTWTWPTNWKGGVTVGTTASACSEQTGTYIAGLGDWHGDAGTVNVPK
jgi:hypothetical protein